MTEYGNVYFDVLILSVEVKDKNQLSQIVHKTLIPYHLFIISNRKNLSFDERYDQEDSIKFDMYESTTFCKLQYDIPSTYLVTNQLKSIDEFISIFPKELKIVKEE